MKFTELKESVKEGACGCYLLQGEDAYFRMKGEEMIKGAFLTMPELNFSSFEGESLKGAALSELVAAVKNYPFMADFRIIRVGEFYPSEADYDKYLKPLFEDFPTTSILIIVNSLSKKGVDLKKKRGITFVDCSKSEPETVTKWIYLTLKRAGIACAVPVCESIGAYCLFDMARVSREVQKLIDYKIEGSLTQGEVDDLVYKDADYRIYEMTNAIAYKRYGVYCAVSADLKSKGMDEISILNGLFSYFKTLLSAISSPLSDAAYAAENGLKEYPVKKNREQARLISEENLKNYVNCIYNAVSSAKSGKISAQSALRLLECTLFFGNK